MIILIFSNKTLSKTYHLTYENTSEVLESAEGTEIQWKPGKNLTVKTVKKKQRHKGGGRSTRTVTKQEPCPSFYNFFKPPQVSEKDSETMERDDLVALEVELEEDYDQGSTIKEKVIPHAILYFTGEAAEEDDVEFDDGGEDEDDEDQLGDDDEEEEEEEEEAPRPKKVPKGNTGAAPGANNRPKTDNTDKPQECKQQ